MSFDWWRPVEIAKEGLKTLKPILSGFGSASRKPDNFKCIFISEIHARLFPHTSDSDQSLADQKAEIVQFFDDVLDELHTPTDLVQAIRKSSNVFVLRKTEVLESFHPKKLARETAFYDDMRAILTKLRDIILETDSAITQITYSDLLEYCDQKTNIYGFLSGQPELQETLENLTNLIHDELPDGMTLSHGVSKMFPELRVKP